MPRSTSAIRADLVAALLGVGAHHLTGSGYLGNPVEHALDLAPDRGVVDIVGLEHDLPGGASAGVEAVLFHQVDRGLALRSRQVELVQELAAECRIQREQADEQHDPSTQDPPAPPIAEAGQALQHGTTSVDETRAGGNERSCRSRSPCLALAMY